MNVSPLLKELVRSQFRMGLRNPITRSAMNRIIDLSPLALKRRVHGAFGLIFSQSAEDWKDCDWLVTFMGRKIWIPLSKSNLNVDWIAAVTLMGHDIGEKVTYAGILLSRYKPDIFLDVGGNLGTHSLLMLSQGVETIYIEPNIICHNHFKRMCERNNFACEMLQCALGDVNGSEKLGFPPDQTWLGSTQQSVIDELAGGHEILRVEVPLMTLDKVAGAIRKKKVLIKIDAEGSEAEILRGADGVISNLRPVFMFEVHANHEKRDGIYAMFKQRGYDLFSQPWHERKSVPLSKCLFIEAANHNFVAIPK